MSYDPRYKVAIISGNTRYNVTNAITKITRNENDGELAQRVSVTLANVDVAGKRLSDIFDVRNRVFVYADDGIKKDEEVFRGFVWEKSNVHKKTKDLTLTCYDNLIYFQESEEYQFFSAGYSTKSICGTLCGKWGVKLNYNYESITHPKLPLRGNLADIFLSDLLDEVKKKKGKKYVMRSIKDEVNIDSVGSNKTIYNLYGGKDGNVTDTESTKTMQGMVTKVVILGQEDDNERAPVKDTVNGNTSTYGTLQKILSVGSGTTLSEVKTEAKELISESGKPREYFSITAVDIPWIRKGDKVKVSAGDMSGHFIVTSIAHYGSDKTMTVEVERA